VNVRALGRCRAACATETLARRPGDGNKGRGYPPMLERIAAGLVDATEATLSDYYS
jgi:hypothetical protein